MLSFTKKLIVDVEPGGTSSRHLDECEREILHILHEFLPPRILRTMCVLLNVIRHY